MRVILLRSGSSGDSNPLLDALEAELRLAKVATISLFPAEMDSSVPIPRADVAVLKDKTPAGLEWGRRLHEAGIPTVSPYPVTVLCRDKLRTNQVLAQAGLPVPECRPVTGPEDLLPMLVDGPVILKPRRGSRGRGIQVIHDSTDVPASWGAEEMFVQRYYEPETLDRKIYRIGEDVFCVERVWPPVTLEEKRGRLIELDATTRELAMECGRVLGTDVYGVDVIEHEGRPWVVDLSSFPGFKGVPEAGARIAKVVLRVAAEARKDDTPPESAPDNGTLCPVP
jgi:lysine biosynthesis enzyme lysX